MVGTSASHLSELAYHIISLSDFWRRSNRHTQECNEVRVISNMIQIFLGVDDPERIARAVIEELDSVRTERIHAEVDPDGIEVLFLSSFLQEQVGELTVPSALWLGLRRISLGQTVNNFPVNFRKLCWNILKATP